MAREPHDYELPAKYETFFDRLEQLAIDREKYEAYDRIRAMREYLEEKYGVPYEPPS